MDKEQLTEALKKAKDISNKKNFRQSVDLIINLKGIDLKKTEQQVNLFVPITNIGNKKVKVCALVGPELLSQAKDICDGAISVDDFVTYSDKKKIKKLANEFDFFIAQATIMPKVAAAFGRVFGPKGKMPSPKAGCVVPPNANLKPLYDRLQKTLKIVTKNDPIIQCSVGKEDMKDEELIDNILTIYNAVIRALPNELHNIKSIFLKLTMGKPVKIGEETTEEKEKRTLKRKGKKEKVTKEEKKEVKEIAKEEKKGKTIKKIK